MWEPQTPHPTDVKPKPPRPAFLQGSHKADQSKCPLSFLLTEVGMPTRSLGPFPLWSPFNTQSLKKAHTTPHLWRSELSEAVCAFEKRVNQVPNTLLNLSPKGVSLFHSRGASLSDRAQALSVPSRASSSLLPTPFTTLQVPRASPRH